MFPQFQSSSSPRRRDLRGAQRDTLDHISDGERDSNPDRRAAGRHGDRGQPQRREL